MDTTAFGFFTFDPDERLDLELVDGVLRAAVDEAGTVDFVFLPESSITADDVEPLEDLLGGYGVWCLVAGVREVPDDHALGANWVHVGIRQEMVWRHATQHKHHRWCLDGRQIGQYHLGGALMATMRWWEAVAIPRRSLQIIDQGAVTIAPLLCEDLARLQPVADLLRAIGPSLVVTLLLDGPQLSSRWTARYASVLADDPGSAVCTLTSFGMARRCRPPGCAPSSVVALWKDASGQMTEIALDDGAQAVLIATDVTVRGASTADGRKHPGTTNVLRLASFQSLRAAPGRLASRPRGGRPDDGRRRGLPPLDEREVSKATSWVEALAEAVFAGPATVERVMAKATAREWRVPLGLPPPTRLFEDSIRALRQELPDDPLTVEALCAAAHRLRRCEDATAKVTGNLIEIAVEQRLLAEISGRRLTSEALAPLVGHAPVH